MSPLMMAATGRSGSGTMLEASTPKRSQSEAMRDSILGRSLQLQKESGHQISNRHTSTSTNLNSSSSSPKKSKKSSQRSKDHSSSSSKMTTAGASYESSKHQSGAAAVDHLSATTANQLVLPVQPHSWVAPDGNNSNIDNSVGSSVSTAKMSGSGRF